MKILKTTTTPRPKQLTAEDIVAQYEERTSHNEKSEDVLLSTIRLLDEHCIAISQNPLAYSYAKDAINKIKKMVREHRNQNTEIHFWLSPKHKSRERILVVYIPACGEFAADVSCLSISTIRDFL